MNRPKVKIAASLDADLVDRLRATVAGGRAASVSAYVEHAIRGQLAAEADFDEIVDEMLAASGGPPTDEERATAQQVLGVPAA